MPPVFSGAPPPPACAVTFIASLLLLAFPRLPVSGAGQPASVRPPLACSVLLTRSGLDHIVGGKKTVAFCVNGPIARETVGRRMSRPFSGRRSRTTSS